MGRIRTIKPEFPQSESIGKLSRDARLLFIQLWTIADDSGRARAASRMLASLLYPYDEDAPALIETWLAELDRSGMIHRFIVDGHSYLEIDKWLKHQKIDHPTASRLPEFREDSRGFANNTRSLAPDHGPVPVPVPVPIKPTALTRAREAISVTRDVTLPSRDVTQADADADADAEAIKPTPSSGASGEFMWANWLMEEGGLPGGSSDLQIVAKVIQAEAREARTDAEGAARYLLGAVKRAKGRSELVNVWWLKDRKYTMEGVENGSGKSHDSPAKRRIDGTRRVLAEIAVREGLIDPSRFDGRAGASVSVGGSGGKRG